VGIAGIGIFKKTPPVFYNVVGRTHFKAQTV
jgi:hypothetical protein